MQTSDDTQESVSDGYKKKLRLQKSKPQPPLPVLSKKEREQYTVKAPYPQSFCYPPAIISYVARNPANLDDHGSLVKSAKSLLRMSRIIPVDNVQNCRDDENKWTANSHTFSLTDNYFEIWTISYLFIRTVSNPYFVSTLLRRVYRCSLEYLKLHHQILTSGELKFLASGSELLFVEFIKNVVKNDVDGSIAEFVDVFEILLKASNIKITFPAEQHGIGSGTARKMIEMLKSRKIRHHISLKNIPESFEFATFACFLKANLTGNQIIKQDIKLNFSAAISQELKNQLQTFVHEILAIVEQNPSLRSLFVPKIKFVGHDEATYENLQGMRLDLRQSALRSRRASTSLWSLKKRFYKKNITDLYYYFLTKFVQTLEKFREVDKNC